MTARHRFAASAILAGVAMALSAGHEVSAQAKKPAPVVTQPGPHQQCAIKIANIARSLGLSRKYANEKSVRAACERTGNNQLAAGRLYLSAVVGATKAEHRAASEAAAQRCVGRVGLVIATLGVTGKQADPAGFHRGCVRARGQASVAARDLLIEFSR
jgi:hypothetical protein